MVKKERILKYLILICTMMVSFFIFSNRDVSAIDFGINNEKIILKIEQVDASDVTKGYEIVGASSTCTLGEEDCVDVAIPASYVDGNPIVKIKDSDNNLQGVLQSLSKVVSGKLILGNEIRTIGKCAFCDFDYIEEYILGESVSMIGEYAFAYNEALDIVEINAYDGNVRSILSNANAFNSTTNLSKLVFKNSSIASTYKNDVSGWSSFASANTNVIFTYKVTYKFYNETTLSTFKPVIAYAGESLGEIIPEAPENKLGLNFKWVSVAYSTDVDSTVIARESEVDVTEGAIHAVAPHWSLKDAVLYIETTEPGDSAVKHELKKNSVEMAYGGKNKALSVAAVVEHELIGQNGFNVEYSWNRSINGVDT
ncbi:leucine-rich repeat protein, partial [bacterium]|nr:leucine-rich repeat protein [bacterium]